MAKRAANSTKRKEVEPPDPRRDPAQRGTSAAWKPSPKATAKARRKHTESLSDIPGVHWFSLTEPGDVWGLERASLSQGIAIPQRGALGVRQACLSYLAQLAARRGRQLSIAGARLHASVAVDRTPLRTSEIEKLIAFAESDFKRNGVSVRGRGLPGSRVWELAVLSTIVLGHVQPDRFNLLSRWDGSGTRGKGARKINLSPGRFELWTNIMLWTCRILASNASIENGSPVRAENLQGRDCPCIHPPVPESALEGQTLERAGFASDTRRMSDLHIRTVEQSAAILLPELATSPLPADPRDHLEQSASLAHATYHAERLGWFAWRFSVVPPLEVPRKDLLGALENAMQAIPRFQDAEAIPPFHSYEFVFDIAAEAWRAAGYSSLVFGTAKQHFSSRRRIDPTAWSELEAAIETLERHAERTERLRLLPRSPRSESAESESATLSLNDDHYIVLQRLRARKPTALTNLKIAAMISPGALRNRQTIGPLVKYLLRHRLVDQLHGQRKGVSINDSGLEMLVRWEKQQPPH
jgi:hypothetical protein